MFMSASIIKVHKSLPLVCLRTRGRVIDVSVSMFAKMRGRSWAVWGGGGGVSSTHPVSILVDEVGLYVLDNILGIAYTDVINHFKLASSGVAIYIYIAYILIMDSRGKLFTDNYTK